MDLPNFSKTGPIVYREGAPFEKPDEYTAQVLAAFLNGS
jgi:hypothetical protein